MVEEPVIFTPDNEPYLGLRSLMILDTTIVASLKLNSDVATYTHRNNLTRLQKAATQIIPQGFNLVLSIRELIRQGHLFSAAVLVRPLIERTGIISYLVENPSALNEWEDGWRHGKRPSLKKMLKNMHGEGEDEGLQDTIDTFNHLVHGDPMSAEFNLVNLDNDALGYGVGRVTNNNNLCDLLCTLTLSWLVVLSAMASKAFPDAVKTKRTTL
ncbi:hypothetical protein PA25_13230 [Pseudoalteromonas sp. A25]|uniref:hypothetical protein n=1 Tax=Pseudoalteromonas sp. A25 TaxID=116092 RepID=UPI0012607E65|nr:hypothetical protein [Pseudoalteromonas sp. A25]BBN81338.1 hypothetical protein PA25_13230 [Pseudoalteromonas sp. A25]